MSRLLEKAGTIAAAMAALTGLFALAAWVLGEWRLTALGSQYSPMASITALLFLLLGAGEVARRFYPDQRFTRGFETAGAALAIVIASLVIAQTRFGFPLPWEAWFASDKVPLAPVPIGRMAILTAVAFLLTGVCTLGKRSADALFGWTSAAAGGLSLIIATFVVASFAANTPRDYSEGNVPMALLSAVAFIFLDAGLLLDAPTLERLRRLLTLDPGDLRRGADRKFAHQLATVTLLIAVLITVIGSVYIRDELAAARATVGEELNTVADLKAREIAQWRTERLQEGRFLQRTPHVSRDVESFLARPLDPIARQRVVDWVEPIRVGHRYLSAHLFDVTGRLRLTLREGGALPSPSATLAQFIAGPTGPEVSLGDLHRTPLETQPHIDLLVPVFSPSGAEGHEAPKIPIATILLLIDPEEYLFPSIRRWPNRSRTAESLLVRREGDDVVYLNVLRHLPNAPMSLRRSINEPLLPAAMAVRGELGTSEGIDYRGVLVLATSRSIEGSAWVLVAKADRSEIYAPMRQEAWQSALLLTLVLLSVGLGAGFLWRERHALTLQRSLDGERERAALAERLAILTRYANDAILLFDEEGHILEANEQAIATYGYSETELRGLTASDLRSDQDRAAFLDRLREMGVSGGVRFESEHRRKDGSVFPAEVSGRAAPIGGRRLIMAIHRDITDRKSMEAALAQNLREVRARNDELSRFNRAMVDRELRMVELKQIINALQARLGETPRFATSPDPGGPAARTPRA